MVTVSDPWAAEADGVPGALPDGVYVRVEDDGRELALVRLDADGGPRWAEACDGDDGSAAWRLGELVGPGSLSYFIRAELARCAQTDAGLLEQIEAARAKGISPFGGW